MPHYEITVLMTMAGEAESKEQLLEETDLFFDELGADYEIVSVN